MDAGSDQVRVNITDLRRYVMKKAISIAAVLFLVSVLGQPFAYAQQQAGPGQGWYCPCWRMGRGGGMMHRGMGHGRGPAARLNRGKPLTKDQAKLMLQRYINSRYISGLKLGEVSDKGNIFEGVITTKDGAVVEKIQVDKNTGWFRNVSS